MPTEITVPVLRNTSLRVEGLVAPRDDKEYWFHNDGSNTFLYFKNGDTPAEACLHPAVDFRGLALKICVIPVPANSHFFVGPFERRTFNHNAPPTEHLTALTRVGQPGEPRQLTRYTYDTSRMRAILTFERGRTLRFRPFSLRAT